MVFLSVFPPLRPKRLRVFLACIQPLLWFQLIQKFNHRFKHLLTLWVAHQRMVHAIKGKHVLLPAAETIIYHLHAIEWDRFVIPGVDEQRRNPQYSHAMPGNRPRGTFPRAWQ
jgi:hypothetical protein